DTIMDLSTATPVDQGLLASIRQQVKHLSQPGRVELLHDLLGAGACRQIGIFPIPPGFKLSVVIPIFNEERWLRELIKRVQAVEIPKEIICVDDFSTDGTRAILRTLESDEVRVFYQPKNQGKGAALREGFRHATGTCV